MGDLLAFKTTEYMCDSGDFADVSEKLVTQSLAFACTFYEPGNVHELKLGRDNAFRFGKTGDDLQTVVRNGHPARIWFDCAERIVCRLGGGGRRQSVKKCRFSHVR